jgi:hypothetical protein
MMYDFEVWSVSVSYKIELDEDQNKVKVPHFTKEKLKRVTRIEDKHAENLNEQSENNLTRYYKKEAEVKKPEPKTKPNA